MKSLYALAAASTLALGACGHENTINVSTPGMYIHTETIGGVLHTSVLLKELDKIPDRWPEYKGQFYENAKAISLSYRADGKIICTWTRDNPTNPHMQLDSQSEICTPSMRRSIERLLIDATIGAVMNNQDVIHSTE